MIRPIKERRATGFYWIKPSEKADWQPARYSQSTNHWALIQRMQLVKEKDIHKVGAPAFRPLRGGKEE